MVMFYYRDDGIWNGESCSASAREEPWRSKQWNAKWCFDCCHFTVCSFNICQFGSFMSSVVVYIIFINVMFQCYTWHSHEQKEHAQCWFLIMDSSKRFGQVCRPNVPVRQCHTMSVTIVNEHRMLCLTWLYQCCPPSMCLLQATAGVVFGWRETSQWQPRAGHYQGWRHWVRTSSSAVTCLHRS